MAITSMGKYRQFFDIDEKYFPCIDDSAIEAGAPWETTYPHQAFIDLLKHTERMLGGTTKRSIWIHGAYGTGKSQCAYALKRILEVPEEELRDYWNRYDSLKADNDLLQKLMGHKERGVVTAYRYASGDITTPRNLFFAIQESVKQALIDNPAITYYGEDTLKESVIAWLEEPEHKSFFNALLNKAEWSTTFSQANADEVLNALKKGSEIKNLMDNIFALADKEGLRAMSMDADMLKTWLKDVIAKNETKIVLVWDEFSGFFKQNRNSLDEFQKIVALCQEAPFYLVVVTHQTDSIISGDDQSWAVVRQRFDFVSITLPDNIAFNLIGHAFNVKPEANDTWSVYADDLNSQVAESRRAVMKAANISDPKVMKDIMPLHPMAALVLKNIAEAFQSNQRSMFDFIKTSNDDDTKAFQWFIEQTGPADEFPLLTIDMLWDFFYDKGRESLSPDIRMILDTYPQQQNLRDDEQRVLKTILIMQSIDKRLRGSIALLKPTEQNIMYAFEGISSGLDITCKSIASGLNERGILVRSPIGDGKFAYGAAVLAGDQSKIDEYKKTTRQTSTTAKLASEGKIATVLSLGPALRLRFAMPAEITSGAIQTVTIADFTRTINAMKDRDISWHFNAVLAVAKDESEATSFRKLIREAALNEDYKNIVFIDALASPLGSDDFEAYVEYSAMAQYYQSNNNVTSSKENANKATQVLSSTWKNRMYNGNFVVYHSGSPSGERVASGSGVAGILQSIVLTRYNHVLDFTKGLTENQLKLTQGKQSAKCGIIGKTSGTVINAEKSVLPAVWNVEKYWTNSATSSQSISIIKKRIEEIIEDAFEKEGQVSIDDINNCLEQEFGFAPCNLTTFLMGFLLKEYSSEPYRYSDISGSHEPMTADKLAEMIGNCVGKQHNPTFILKMTADEKAFYELTESVWNISKNTCSSASQAAISVKNKMQSLGLPVWCLAEVDNTGAYDIVEKYIDLVQKEGHEAHKIALIIGAAARNKPSIENQLKDLITQENCQKGMRSFIQSFEGGRLNDLAKEIGASDKVLKDIGELFSVEYSSLWNVDTGTEQIKTLIDDYSFVRATNDILDTSASSKREAFGKWVDKLKFTICTCESLKGYYPEMESCWDFLLNVYKGNEILPDQIKEAVDKLSQHTINLKAYFANENKVFAEIYDAYLEGISDEEIPKLRVHLIDVFKMSKTEGNALVKNVADDYRRGQVKNQLFELWRTKTASKSPAEWSSKHRTPIMKMVRREEYDEAKRTFETLNRGDATEKEITAALKFVEQTKMFESFSNQDAIDEAFDRMLGKYKVILSDKEKVRDALDTLPIPPYEWDNHPEVREKIFKMAKAEYDSGGSDLVISRIEKMDNQKLKEYLAKQIKENMSLGLEIMNGGE